jgi:hypothetical protein
MKVYRELYKHAQPPADFDELIKSGEAFQQDFYKKYYLDNDEMLMIMKKVIGRHKLSPREKNAIEFEILLGASPTSAKRGAK